MIDDTNNPPPEGEDHPLHFPVPEVPDDAPVFDAQAFLDIEKGVMGALSEAGFVAPSRDPGDTPRTGEGGRQIPIEKSFAEVFPDEPKQVEVRGMDELLRIMKDIAADVEEIKGKILGS